MWKNAQTWQAMFVRGAGGKVVCTAALQKRWILHQQRRRGMHVAGPGLPSITRRRQILEDTAEAFHIELMVFSQHVTNSLMVAQTSEEECVARLWMIYAGPGGIFSTQERKLVAVSIQVEG